MDYHYRLNCGQYVLHDGDMPIHEPLDEIAIAFDRQSGTLHMHGEPEMVEKWLKNAKQRFQAAGFNDMANDLMIISGRFELDDLNRCLSTTGYIGRLYERIQRGETVARSLDADIKPRAKP